MPLCLGEAHEHYVAEQLTAPAIAFSAYRISWPGRLWDWVAEAYNEGYWSGIERIISPHTSDKALWIITEERWLGSCSLWQAGLYARSRNAIINVQLCKWWMACEGWNLPSTTLAKINRGSAIRADPGLWRYPPFTRVSLDFQLVDWPISREAGPIAKPFWEQLKQSGTHFHTLDTPSL